MENQIIIYETITPADVDHFWEKLHNYFKRDIFPDPEDEDLEYFLSETQYREPMQKIHDRKEDRCYYLFFNRNGQEIGFAMPVIYTSEDGKCFIMEFCVYPQFRGNGTGKACAKTLLNWAKTRGAQYAELNSGNDPRRVRFWESIGFIKNGYDEWGEPLMILPPEEELPITVEILNHAENWQLMKLENGFLHEIGEPAITEEKQAQLVKAIQEGKITFFIAKRDCRAVGMCSIVRCFSTFTCSEIGILDDFYIEPAFRRKGIARILTTAAQKWAAKTGLASLSVTCAPCDEKMYQALGFRTKLGSNYAVILK